MLEVIRNLKASEIDSLTDEERRAVWHATWTNLPMAACTIVVFNVKGSVNENVMFMTVLATRLFGA